MMPISRPPNEAAMSLAVQDGRAVRYPEIALGSEAVLQRWYGLTRSPEAVPSVAAELRRHRPDESNSWFNQAASALAEYRIPVAEYVSVLGRHPDARKAPYGMRTMALIKALDLKMDETWRLVDHFRNVSEFKAGADFVVLTAAKLRDAGLHPNRIGEVVQARKDSPYMSVEQAIEQMRQKKTKPEDVLE
jgi:hypothetical protein